MLLYEMIAVILILTTFVFLIIGSIFIHRTLKSKSSFLLMVCMIILPIGILAYSIFEQIVFHEYDVDNLPVFINSIYSLKETIFPAIILFLSGLGFYGVAKDIKTKTNKAN
jgi:hypothetical protein